MVVVRKTCSRKHDKRRHQVCACVSVCLCVCMRASPFAPTNMKTRMTRCIAYDKQGHSGRRHKILILAYVHRRTACLIGR